MKNAIKAILPQTLLNQARKIRDERAVKSVPLLDFYADALKSENDIDLGAIWNDEIIAEGWNAHQSEIKNVFQEDERWGGINMGDRRALYYLIRGLKPKSVLEVGTHIGTSTLYITKALQAEGNGEENAVTTVDILDVNNPHTGAWPGLGMRQSPQDNVKELGCDGIVKFVANTAQDFMKQAVAESQKFDFIFLDGDHTAQGVYREMELALKLLNKGGIILLHDYYPEGKALFKDGNIIYGPFLALEAAKKHRNEFTVKPLGALEWATKQGSQNTSLALVVKQS